MRILANKKWRDGFVDYPKNRKEYRVKVLGFKNLEKLENVYHIRPKSLRLLLNYFPVMGLEGTFYKTWSRLREDYRNEKYISCGFGEIIETAQDGSFSVGDLVGFLAPWHPALAERIVLPENLILKIDRSDLPQPHANKILHLPVSGQKTEGGWWKDLLAWSVYSGVAVSPEIQKKISDCLVKELKNAHWAGAEAIDALDPKPISETKGSLPKAEGGKKTGILFGYGNYAKINIIPYTRPFVDIQTVHEIDPTEIFLEQRIQKWDSSPIPRKGEKADAYFIATYNHFHALLAIHALNQGAYALVEKPAVNDYEELDELEAALKKSGPRLFIGFQKRYGPFNKWALKDLGVRHGEPIFYNSIVYELKQPEFFWYNWPVSRSTFYANACHQIDHFLYLNNFSKPKDFDLKLLSDNTIVTWIELENGATLTSTFSEKGSPRIGPKDVVELKVTGKIVRILDATHYTSEDTKRIIRKEKVLKPTSYKDMYKTIARKIANNEPGDSIDSVITSTKIMLDLEEKLQRAKGWGDRYARAKKEFSKYFEGENYS
ncbi:MAG: Gfo/Idh/MocA family oxidoreductase [Candidatus Brennerbacteria bacterium]|nr:Gfo/Idh/MocA family oxidoreductase [Candidatus Brennerbacteria bacterium]